MKRPLIIGHRGFARRFPHNSLAGVQAALAVGADGIEVDVRPTSDGVWVCHHDRTRDGRPLSQWRYRDLAVLGIPALGAVLETVPLMRWLFLEVKPLAFARLLAGLDSLVRHLEGRYDKLQILSSSLSNLALLRQALPKARFSWVVSRLPASLPPGTELSPHHSLVEPLLSLSCPLHPWTVNRTARMDELTKLGVASLTTDVPDRAVEWFGR